VSEVNMWGTDPALIDEDEFCVGCEHSTIADDDGSRHYDGCPERARRAAVHAAAVSAANKLWPVAHTADGVLIVPGLVVWTNNVREATVTRYLHSDTWPDGRVVPWFDTTDAMCDGSRMTTVLNGKRAGS
jgi:hypothetical protein